MALVLILDSFRCDFTFSPLADLQTLVWSAEMVLVLILDS